MNDRPVYRTRLIGRFLTHAKPVSVLAGFALQGGRMNDRPRRHGVPKRKRLSVSVVILHKPVSVSWRVLFTGRQDG